MRQRRRPPGRRQRSREASKVALFANRVHNRDNNKNVQDHAAETLHPHPTILAAVAQCPTPTGFRSEA